MRVGLTCLVLATPAWLAGGPPPAAECGTKGGSRVATIAIRPKADEFRAGEPVELEAVLENQTDHALWVNKRLLLNSGFVPAPYRELWLSVVGPEGKECRFECKVRASEAGPRDYRVLAPSEKLTSSFRLDQCFDFGQAGSYRVFAQYADGNRNVPPAPEGAEHLGGTIRSNEVTIRIR